MSVDINEMSVKDVPLGITSDGCLYVLDHCELRDQSGRTEFAASFSESRICSGVSEDEMRKLIIDDEQQRLDEAADGRFSSVAYNEGISLNKLLDLMADEYAEDADEEEIAESMGVDVSEANTEDYADYLREYFEAEALDGDDEDNWGHYAINVMAENPDIPFDELGERVTERAIDDYGGDMASVFSDQFDTSHAGDDFILECTSMGQHDAFDELRWYAIPPELCERLRTAWGEYHLKYVDGSQDVADDLTDLITQLGLAKKDIDAYVAEALEADANGDIPIASFR